MHVSIYSFLFILLMVPITIFADASSCTIDGGDIATLMQNCQPDGSISANLESTDAIKETIKKALLTLISVGSLLCVGVIVYAGFQYTTLYEDEGKVKKAKQTAIAALIGLLIMIFTFPFLDILVKFLYEIGSGGEL